MKGAGFTFGLGCGIIFITVIFYTVYSFTLPADASATVAITDEYVVAQATKLGMIFFDTLPNTTPSASISDEEIIERASGMGMVFQPIEEGSGIPEQIKEPDIIEQAAEPEEDIKATSYIDIYIPSGSSASDISSILYKNGLVEDADKFLDFLKSKSVTKKLKNGYLNLPTSGNFEDILGSLTNRRTFP